MKPIILAIDGCETKQALEEKIRNFFNLNREKTEIKDYIEFVKINDAVFLPDKPAVEIIKFVRKTLKEVGSNAGIFLDLKLADTWGTNKNHIKHFVDADTTPDILTIRSEVSAKTFLELRRLVPNTKLAMVGALTDISINEFKNRYGLSPALKLINDITNIQREYEEIKDQHDPAKAFDMMVCSPLELSRLKAWFPFQFQFIVPGIRDKWMEKGQQARSTGIREALNMGATYVVMGSQLTKGNPSAYVGVLESCHRTIEEIKHNA